MKKLTQKDKKRRKFVNKLELNRLILKSIIKNSNFSSKIRWNAIKKLDSYNNKSCLSKTVNFCVVRKNRKKVTKFFKFSRLTLLKFLRTGTIGGFMKASW